jgi:hypothetical protein
MKLLNVDKKQRILNKASNLGLKRIDSKWNKEEIQFIKDNFEKMSYKEIGKLLNRTEFAVCTKIGRLKLNKVTK